MGFGKLKKGHASKCRNLKNSLQDTVTGADGSTVPNHAHRGARFMTRRRSVALISQLTPLTYSPNVTNIIMMHSGPLFAPFSRRIILLVRHSVQTKSLAPLLHRQFLAGVGPPSNYLYLYSYHTVPIFKSKHWEAR